MFITDVLRFLVGPEFWPAAPLIPVLLFAFVLRPLSDFCSFGLLIGEKTKLLAHSSWLSAGVMTLGYLFLIPRFGPMGAAATTFVGFGVELFLINRWASRYYNMQLPWGRFAIAWGIAMVALMLSHLVDGSSLMSVAYRGAILVSAIVLVVISPATRSSERQRVGALLRQLAKQYVPQLAR
jgi:O-antigen/teichoic acid export membrane protein